MYFDKKTEKISSIH